MPNTIHFPSMRRIGCTTWACCPTTAVIAGARPSRRASAVWKASGARRYSVPQCRLTITTRAPARRARRASRVIRRALREVDRPRMRQPDPVGHLRVGQIGDADALRVQHQDPAPLARRRERPRVRYARPVERAAGGDDAALAAVQRVVRGGVACVVARRLDRSRQRPRGVEARIAGRRGGRQRGLEVTEREVVRSDPRPDAAEHRAEVVAPVPVRPRAGDERQMREQVAADADGQAHVGRRRRGILRRRRARAAGEQSRGGERRHAHPSPPHGAGRRAHLPSHAAHPDGRRGGRGVRAGRPA